MNKEYIRFDPARGFPAGKELYYECGVCGELLPSLSEERASCSCENVFNDVEAGRLAIRDESKLRLVRLKLRASVEHPAIFELIGSKQDSLLNPSPEAVGRA